jgi:alanyl-tRNA synthetase
MHPLVPFLLGEKHPQGKRLVNVQRCIRTGDIDEVGNTTHHTFFEMLGNWSLGDYFKKETIEMSHEFLTKTLKIPSEKISATCFAGDDDAPKDTESEQIWKSLKIKEVKFLGKKDNWWGPAGTTGPCGPDTEMFINGVEIWNDVLMQYNKDEKGNYNEAKQKNIDTGMGVERTIAVLEGLEDNYLADMWLPIIKQIEKLSNKKYTFTKGDLGHEKMPSCWEDDMRSMRIIADHIKAAVFIIADGITPSNSEQGYVLRRLIRRAIRYAKNLGIPQETDLTTPLVKEILKIYDDYDILKNNKQKIIDELNREEDQFEKTLEKGLRVFNKHSNKNIDGKTAFLLFQSYGFPLEMTVELAKEKGIKVNEKDFQKAFNKHQELSRTASAGKFKSGLADNSEQTTKLHTACHLLNQALREVLNDKNIFQRGSNITPERLRFDFNFDRKLTDEEKTAIEDLINKKIKEAIPVELEEITLDQAKAQGAQGVFDTKYGDKVKVYSIGKDFSKEICAGPHVDNTSELGTFKITKEGSSGAGVRRIKAILE